MPEYLSVLIGLTKGYEISLYKVASIQEEALLTLL